MSMPPPPPSAPPTSGVPPLPPPGSPPRKLVRLSDQGKVAGVCAGIGWYFGIDPTLVRIALIVLTIGTGLGFPAYIMAWVLMPEAKSASSQLSPPPAPKDGRSLGTIALLILAGVLLIGQVDLFSGEVLTAALLIGAGVLLFTDASPLNLGNLSSLSGLGKGHGCGGHGVGHGSTASHGPRWSAPADEAAASRTGMAPPLTHVPETPPEPQSAYAPYAGAWRDREEPLPAPPTRPRSFLGGLAVAAWLAAMGVATLLDRMGAVDLTATAVVAITVTVCGVALLVGTIFGRARGLIAIGVAGTLLLLPLSTVSGLDIGLGAGIGERIATPRDAAAVPESYDMLFGSQTIDLTDLQVAAGDTLHIDAGMVAGEVIVIVPDDVGVQVEGRIEGGEYTVFGEPVGGTDLDISEFRDGGEDVGTIALQVDMVFGELVVRGGDAEGTLVPQAPEAPEAPEAPVAPEAPAAPAGPR